MQVKPQELTKETVLKAAQQLVKMKFNPGAVIKVVKQQTGLGFSVKQVTATKEKKAPASVIKTVERKVAAEIAKEAVAKIDAVLDTGKSLEDALGPIARSYGYETTTQFVLTMYGFWTTWKDHVAPLVTERDQYRWAINELMERMSPEARKVLAGQAVKELVISLATMGSLTGHFPPPDVLKGYIQLLRDEMKT